MKTHRTPKLIQIGLHLKNGERIVGWRVIADGKIIGVISRPSPGVWEYNGSLFHRRVDAVQRVIDSNNLSLEYSA